MAASVVCFDSPLRSRPLERWGDWAAGRIKETSYIYSSAAAGALLLELEYAAESAVHLVQEGCRRMADGFLEVCLIEGDESGDVDD